MADIIQDTDQFLVNRSDSTATVTASNLMADLLDSDLMLVNRSDQTYTVTGKDVKDSIGGGPGPLPSLGGIAVVLPEAPFVGATLTCVASGEGGLPPYSYEYQWYRNGVEMPGEIVNEYFIGGNDVGTVFKCEAKITDDNGDEFVVMSNETEASRPVATPPAINTVTLTEKDPSAPRFTDQKFITSVNMALEGEPVSVKTFDAYVEGRITQAKQFIEPLESSGTGTQGVYTGKGIVSSPSGFFEGSADTPFIGGTVDYCSTNSTTNGGTQGYGATNSIYMDLKKLADAGMDVRGKKLEVYMNSPAANMQATVWATDKTTMIVSKTSVGSPGYNSLGVIPQNADIGELQVFAQSISNRGYMFHIKVDGVVVKDNGPGFNTALTFASGTDMSALEAGDEVTQPSEITARVWSGDVSEAGGAGPKNPENMFDGSLSTYAESNAFNKDIVWNTSAYPLTGTLKVYVGLTASSPTYTVLYKDKNNNNKTRTFPGDSGFFELSVEELTYFQVKYGPYQNYTQIKGIELDGALVINNQPISAELKGTVGSITDTTVNLTSDVGGWTNGEDVTGPDKTIVIDNAKKYLKFDSNGNVSDLLDSPQNPPYDTLETNPILTLTFPSTFPSGQAPDQEIGEGATLTAEVTATNLVGDSGPLTSTVQPENTLQFNAPLESHSTSGTEIPADDWGNYVVFDGSGGGQADMFNNDHTTACYGFTNSAFIRWAPPKATFGYFDDLVIKFGIDFPGSWEWTFKDEDGNVENHDAVITGVDFSTYATEYDCSTLSLNNIVEVGLRYKQVGASRINRTWINGVPVIQGQSIVVVPGVTTLTFPADTNMTYLADGDDVQQIQPGGQPVWSASLPAGWSSGSAIFDGDRNTYAGSPSMTLNQEIGCIDLVDKWPVERYMKFKINCIGGQVQAVAIKNGVERGLATWGTSSPNEQTIDFGANIGVENDGFNQILFRAKSNGTLFNLYYIEADDLLFEDNGPKTVSGTVASIASTDVELTEIVPGWINGEKVYGPDKTVFRSLTEEELAKQKLKFSTYDNRAAVYQGEQAMAQREALVKELQERGIDASEVLGTKAKRGRRKQN